MPSEFIFSSSSFSASRQNWSALTEPTGRNSAFLLNSAHFSIVPPTPTPTITGGQGLPPAFDTVSTINFFIPSMPSEGVSIARALMFSLPKPFGATVIFILSPDVIE